MAPALLYSLTRSHGGGCPEGGTSGDATRRTVEPRKSIPLSKTVILSFSATAWREPRGRCPRKRARGLSEAVGDEPSDQPNRFRTGGSMASPPDTSEQLALEIGNRQSMFREVNERIEAVAADIELLDEIPIFCEC